VRRGDLPAVAAVFLLALALRLYGVGYPPQRWVDEQANMAGAVNYAEGGRFEPDTWQHPPLRHLVGYAFLRVLGDNPWGWRLKNVLLGAAAAVLAWLFTLHVTSSRRAALLAGLLLATDPLHVVLSRFTFEEVYGGAFFLGAVVLWLLHRQRTSWLLASALLMGCALGTKWYYVPAWLLLFALLLREHGNWRDVRTVLFLACCWLVVPLTVYVAAYLPWFGRGYGLAELPEHVVDAFAFLQAMTEHYVSNTDTRTVFHGHASALEWFVRPILIGYGFHPEPDRWEFVLYGNDLPIWGLALPAVIATLVLAIRDRRPALALPALLFLAPYLPLVLARRPVFVYSAIPLVPFAFAAIGAAVARLADRFGARLYAVAVVVMVGWNLYLYPLVATRRVPLAPYRWLLDGAEILMH
jgi:dolichyl-phosphate-mannose-protein mannosyltransferase